MVPKAEKVQQFIQLEQSQEMLELMHDASARDAAIREALQVRSGNPREFVGKWISTSINTEGWQVGEEEIQVETLEEAKTRGDTKGFRFRFRLEGGGDPWGRRVLFALQMQGLGV